MNLSKEMALRLHRMMWTDMRETLGDNPDHVARYIFKHDWIEQMFPGERVQDNCFLCEFAGLRQCNNRCPIKWCDGDYNICAGVGVDYRFSPISEILALPEREVKGPAFKIDEKAAPDIVEGPSLDVMIRRELSQASGLAGWTPINEHIEVIKSRGYIAGREDMLEEMTAFIKTLNVTEE